MDSSLRGGGRAATIRQRLSEVMPSRSDYRRLGDYPARNGQRLSSDYSATIAEQIPRRSFSKLSKNFSKTRSEFFQNRSKNRAVFCAAGEGLSRRRDLGSGWLGRLGDGRQSPRGRARSAAGGDPRDAADTGGAIWQRSGCVARDAGSRRHAAGLRVWQSCGLLLRSIAVMPLWGVYAPAMAFLRRGIGIYTLSYKKRSEGVLWALRAIDAACSVRTLPQGVPGRA